MHYIKVHIAIPNINKQILPQKEHLLRSQFLRIEGFNITDKGAVTSMKC